MVRINWRYWRKKVCLRFGCLVRPIINHDPAPGPPNPGPPRDYVCVVCGDRFQRVFQREMG